MNINLNNVGIGHELNNYEMCVLKASHLNNHLKDINSNLGSNFNYMIIPMAVYNILDDRILKPFCPVSETINCPYYVGMFDSFECYVDLYMSSDTILLQYDKQKARNNKIDIILDNIESLSEVRISITGLI